MDDAMTQLAARKEEVEQAATLAYWYDRTPGNLPVEKRNLLARASLVTFRLMVRIGVR